jgi:hypothetical protein
MVVAVLLLTAANRTQEPENPGMGKTALDHGFFSNARVLEPLRPSRRHLRDGALASPLSLERLFGSIAPDFEFVLKLVKAF